MEGAGFDLPMAVGILAAAGILKPEELLGLGVVGELALDGAIRPVRGALPMAVAARRQELKALVVPEENAAEAAVVEGVTILPAARLDQVVDHLSGRSLLPPRAADPALLMATPPPRPSTSTRCAARRSQARLTIAAAGGHNLLMVGPRAAARPCCPAAGHHPAAPVLPRRWR